MATGLVLWGHGQEAEVLQAHLLDALLLHGKGEENQVTPHCAFCLRVTERSSEELCAAGVGKVLRQVQLLRYIDVRCFPGSLKRHSRHHCRSDQH